MRWTVHGEEPLYESEWVRLTFADVELPSGRRLQHHVVRMPQQAAGTVVWQDRSILLLYRHRFITDTWGYEIPAGRIDPGEDAVTAAAREVLEETGWRPGPLQALCTYQPTNGLSDQRFHLFLASGATHEGPPSDPDESTRLEWASPERVRELVLDGQIVDGLSLTALLYSLSFPGAPAVGRGASSRPLRAPGWPW